MEWYRIMPIAELTTQCVKEKTDAHWNNEWNKYRDAVSSDTYCEGTLPPRGRFSISVEVRDAVREMENEE